MTRFFVPLALQSASQGLTYPLVAMVASRGPGGPLNLAALARRPLIVIAGQAGFLGTVVSAAAICLSAGVPGILIGAVGLCLGNLASTGTLRVLLRWAAGPEMPVPHTTISPGQVR